MIRLFFLQDRCYSKTFESSTEVEKGCTQSQSCVGTTTCCQGEFCNAGNFFWLNNKEQKFLVSYMREIQSFQ